MGGDLYARFIFIIAPTKQVVGADNGFQIGQDIFQRDKGRQGLANHGRAPQTSTDDHFKPALPILQGQSQTNVMRLSYGAVMGAACDSNLEFARQKLELWMIG